MYKKHKILPVRLYSQKDCLILGSQNPSGSFVKDIFSKHFAESLT